MAKNEKTIIKNVRCIYPHLVEAQKYEGKEETAKYSITVLIPKDDKETLSAFRDYVKKQVDGTGWKKTVQDRVIKVAFDTDPHNKFCVIKDGDLYNQKRVEEDEKEAIEAYAGHYFIKASKKASFGKVPVVNQSAQAMSELEIQSKLDSGDWVNVEIGTYCYPKPDPGVSIQVSAVQLVKTDAFPVQTSFEPIETDDAEEEETGAFDD
jgi:hypothetical protein